jgi:uncharacterized membrane protein
MLDPIDNLINYKFGMFYFNKSDSRFLVPKRNRSMGWTLNFAHSKAVVFFFLIVAGLMIASFFN